VATPLSFRGSCAHRSRYFRPQILHDLLGDGRATLRPPRVTEIADEGADDTALINAMMLKEVPILGGDKCSLHVIWNIVEANPNAPVAGREHLGVGLLLAIQYCAHAGQLPAFQRKRIRKFGGSVIEKVNYLAKINDRIGDILALTFAELLVGGG